MRLMRQTGNGILLSAFLGATLLAQFEPQGSQVISYFPQLADGGPAGQQWVTALTLSNPHFVLPVNGSAFFIGDSGTALSLDFGNGPVSTFDFTIPPQGTVTFTSTGASPTTVTGWAQVLSSLPVQGVVQFRSLVNGVPQQGVSAESTVASGIFRSPATASTGIAVANPYNTLTVRVFLAALDGDGNQVASTTLSLPGLGHRAFNLNQMLPMLAPDFRGSVQISADIDTTVVAWTLSTEGGVLSSYPPSALAWPPSAWELIWKVWSKVSASSSSLVAPVGLFHLGVTPDLSIDFAKNSINVFADTTQNVVHVVQNMAELTSDSESELAFVLGHALGHIIQSQAGRGLFNSLECGTGCRSNQSRVGDAGGV
jgi:hypothetical protein